MKLLRSFLACMCCLRRLYRQRRYSHEYPKSKNQIINENDSSHYSSSKVHRTISVGEHYSYVDGVYIFDKAKMQVIKTEQSPWGDSHEEPALPTEGKVAEVRKRLSSL